MRITVVSILALLVCIAGLLMYAFASNGKVIHIGDTMFWTGLLATLIGAPSLGVVRAG